MSIQGQYFTFPSPAIIRLIFAIKSYSLYPIRPLPQLCNVLQPANHLLRYHTTPESWTSCSFASSVSNGDAGIRPERLKGNVERTTQAVESSDDNVIITIRASYVLSWTTDQQDADFFVPQTRSVISHLFTFVLVNLKPLEQRYGTAKKADCSQGLFEGMRSALKLLPRSTGLSANHERMEPSSTWVLRVFTP
jgi:hypothetical protein